MKKILLTSVVTALVLGGCSTAQQSTPSTDKSADAQPVKPAPQANTANSSLYPPNAKPGQCYARVLTPAKYKNVQERVMAKAAGADLEVVPATYQTVTEKILVSEATTKLVVVPETYKTVTEKVLVEPAKETLVKVPAKYKTVTEKILVKPAYTKWKRGSNPLPGSKTRFDESTGEIMCLVTVPAEYKTVKKQVVATPATTIKKTTPARYKTVTKRVVATQATTKKVTVPAKYRTVQVRKLVTPTKTIQKPIPAVYKTVTKRVVVTEPKLEWRSILCETNTTPDVIRRLQLALKEKGYKPGRTDGVLGRETLQAVVKYQKANNLPSGQLTIGTLQSLGVQQ